VEAAVALALTKAGASVYLIGHRLNLLQAVAAKARSLGSEAACYSGDLAQYDLTKHALKAIADSLRGEVNRTEFEY
jgi:NADP-dependent 3-hydroxy acid dehydrogenase YdfG